MSRFILIVINLQKKFHFIIFNSILFNSGFYGSRILLHCKININFDKEIKIPYELILIVITLLLLMLDILAFVKISLNLKSKISKTEKKIPVKIKIRKQIHRKINTFKRKPMIRPAFRKKVKLTQNVDKNKVE